MSGQRETLYLSPVILSPVLLLDVLPTIMGWLGEQHVEQRAVDSRTKQCWIYAHA